MNNIFFRIFLCSTACTFTLQLSAATPTETLYVLNSKLNELQQTTFKRFPFTLAQIATKATLIKTDNVYQVNLDINLERSSEYTSADAAKNNIAGANLMIGASAWITALSAVGCLITEGSLVKWSIPTLTALWCCASIKYRIGLDKDIEIYNNKLARLISKRSVFLDSASSSYATYRVLIGQGIKAQPIDGLEITNFPPDTSSYFKLYEAQVEKYKNLSSNSERLPGSNPGYKKNDQGENDNVSNQTEGEPGEK